MGSAGLRWFLRIMSGAVLVFLYVPLVVVVLYAFSKSPNATWPPELFTTSWFDVAWKNSTLRPALEHSLEVALAATAIALMLGTLASFGMAHARFFGRDTISFALVLPIAFPGIVTAIALASFVDAVPGLNFGIPAIILGHATFCVVVVFNNVVARLRRIVPVDARGVDGSRGRRVYDLPLHHVSGDEDRARRGWPARLRPVVRRDRRHELSVRCDADLAASGSTTPSSGR